MAGKRGHSNIHIDKVTPWPSDQTVARIPISGGAKVDSVKPLPPLALHRGDWEKIGQVMGWLPAPTRNLAQVQAALTFNDSDAKGTVGMERCGQGVTLIVNGREVAWVDLFPCVEGGPAQLLLDDNEYDDIPLAKVVFLPDAPVLVVNGNAEPADIPTTYLFHSDGRDRAYRMPQPTGDDDVQEEQG